MRKYTTFCNATNGNERRNSILMTAHYSDLGSVSDWLKEISQAERPIRSTTSLASDSMEFLRSFLDVISKGNCWWRGSRNVVCFLRLTYCFSRFFLPKATKGFLPITSFYFHDQNPSEFCILVQSTTFDIQTLLGLLNCNIKSTTKRILFIVLI